MVETTESRDAEVARIEEALIAHDLASIDPRPTNFAAALYDAGLRSTSRDSENRLTDEEAARLIKYAHDTGYAEGRRAERASASRDSEVRAGHDGAAGRLRAFAEKVAASEADTPGTRAAARYALTGTLEAAVDEMRRAAEPRGYDHAIERDANGVACCEDHAAADGPSGHRDGSGCCQTLHGPTVHPGECCTGECLP